MPIFFPDARVTLGVVFESIREVNDPIAFPVRPQEITVYRNGYNEADTFSVKFNATHLPITPELVRAASAEIYIFNKRSIDEQPDSLTKQDDPGLFLDGVQIKPSIVGLIDDASLDYDETGRYFTLTGRDYTSLYLDTEWDARIRIPYKGRLDTVIQRLADDVPGSAGIIKVRVDIPEVTLFAAINTFSGGLEGELDKALPIVGRTESRANKKGLVFPNKANFWEVMSAIAVRYGFIIFIKGLDIILTTPKAYLEGRTGFLAMAWGKNLHDIHISRKLGKERVPTIECISWDSKRQQNVIGRFPNEASSRKSLKEERIKARAEKKAKEVKKPKKNTKKRKKGEAATGLGTVRDEVQQFVIPGITSEKQLEAIAEQVHTQKGRSEMTLQLSTSDLQDLEGKTILDISSGDAIQVKYDSFNQDIVFERLVSELVAKGYDIKTAGVFAQATEQANELRQPMRVDDATIDFDIDDGISITTTMRQFVNIYVQQEKA